MAEAFSSGPGSMVQTDSWSTVDNHGGLQVTTVYSNGTEIGYNVAGTTDCSQVRPSIRFPSPQPQNEDYRSRNMFHNGLICTFAGVVCTS